LISLTIINNNIIEINIKILLITLPKSTVPNERKSRITHSRLERSLEGNPLVAIEDDIRRELAGLGILANVRANLAVAGRGDRTLDADGYGEVVDVGRVEPVEVLADGVCGGVGGGFEGAG
jgi:hypothetical protein